MSITYWLVDSNSERLCGTDSIQDLKESFEDLESARYKVDEISSKLLPSSHMARRWAGMLKLEDGRIMGEPDPWEP